MEISLEQAIEIHAKVLRHSHGDSAPRRARDFAAQLARRGDHEGHVVWTKVAEVAETLPRQRPERLS